MSTAAWHDAPTPESMADALSNVLWALDEMLSAIDGGRYQFERVHVEADLRYLRAEARRAKRQRAAADHCPSCPFLACEGCRYQSEESR